MSYLRQWGLSFHFSHIKYIWWGATSSVDDMNPLWGSINPRHNLKLINNLRGSPSNYTLNIRRTRTWTRTRWILYRGSLTHMNHNPYIIKFDSSQIPKLATCITYALSTPNDELGILQIVPLTFYNNKNTTIYTTDWWTPKSRREQRQKHKKDLLMFWIHRRRSFIPITLLSCFAFPTVA